MKNLFLHALIFLHNNTIFKMCYSLFCFVQCHEEIAWSSDPETLKLTQAFREGTIHQHIYQQVKDGVIFYVLLVHKLTCFLCFLSNQDGKTLDFLYYFDYLRAYPHVYSEMTKPYGPPGGK